MFVGSFFVFVTILTSVYGTCQSLDGQSVPWWILYQQKERPFFHQYVDSTNSHRVKEHYPERRDSVLSKVVSSVINKEEAEYIIYSSDLINVKDIAGKTSIPTYSKWMHGILGTVSSWDSGFWILHNNLLFPAITNGVLAEPGSKAWYATTVGDNSADLFYICLTADTRGNITEILTSIMAGNPLIYRRKLHNYNFLQPYFKEVRSLQTSFGYEMSASIFLDCLYTSSSNVSTNCLFTYAVTTGAGIHVLTRPRGMIKHSSAFCYDDHSISQFDFLSLERRSTLKSGFSHSMFALSGKTDSSSDGITCFGQDVATHAETVAVMVCAHLPKVHVNVVKSARLTQWSCKNKYGRPNRSNMYSQGKGTLETDIVTEVKETNTFVTPTNNNEDGNSNQEEYDTTYDSDGKKIDKFCMIYDCNTDDDINKEQEVFDASNWKNPLMKNYKIADWFSKLSMDITIEHNIQNPQKIDKLIEKENNAIVIKGSSEVSRFLLNNKKVVLALFCQEGCRFCQNAREQIKMLAKSIQADYLDFVIVDIKEPSLPDDLHVPFTPFVRYRVSTLSNWIDYLGQKYDMAHIVAFLHSTTIEQSKKDEEIGIQNSRKLGTGKRKRRDTGDFIEEQSFKVPVSRISRLKRYVDVSLEEKHIWKYNGDIALFTKAQAIDKLKELNLTLKNKRTKNTFLLTLDAGSTINKLDAITKEYFENIFYKEMKHPNNSILFHKIDITMIDAKLVHINTNKNICWYASTGGVVFGAIVVNKAQKNFKVSHFETKPEEEKELKFSNCKIEIPKYEKKETCNT